MEVFVVGAALITLDAFVLARFGYGRLRSARRRAFLERRLGIIEPAVQQPAPQRAVVAAGVTPSPTFA
jgi:hypothetical protein